MSRQLSTNQQLNAAIALCEALGIEADDDDNLWAIIEYVDFDGIVEKFGL